METLTLITIEVAVDPYISGFIAASMCQVN